MKHRIRSAQEHPLVELDEAGLYPPRFHPASGHPMHYVGRVWRVCPTLLEQDARHGQRHDEWPDCRRTAVNAKGELLDAAGEVVKHGGGRPVIGCRQKHDHESLLEDLEGHDANTFVYAGGCRPETDDEWPRCSNCGQPLVCSDGDPI